MNILYPILFVVATIVAAIYYVFYMRANEGFENADDTNPITKVMEVIRRLSTTLMDTNMWKERILMSNMTPVELARHHLNSTAKTENAETV